MMRFERLPEPAYFDEEVRKPGNIWLKVHPEAKSDSLPKYWTRCLKDLTIGFGGLCNYSAMWTTRPTVDHYLCRSSRAGRSLTYEWDNYRLADINMNSAKGTWDDRILDPFMAVNDWFEVLLPNMELVVIEENVPPEYRDRARFTLKQLGLGDDEEVLEIRRAWFNDFVDGDVNLAWLAKRAPLIAQAIQKRLDQISPAAFHDEQTSFSRVRDGEMNLKTLRRLSPRLAETIDGALRSPDGRPRQRGAHSRPHPALG